MLGVQGDESFTASFEPKVGPLTIALFLKYSQGKLSFIVLNTGKGCVGKVILAFPILKRCNK